MDKRKSLILHFDSLEVLNELNNEQIANLFVAIRDYNLQKEVKLDWLMKAIFIPFKNQFDRDFEKYKKKCDINAENIKKRWDTKTYKSIPNNTNGINGIDDDTNHTYNDSDSKNDNDNKKDSEKKENITDVTAIAEVKKDNRKVEINEAQELIKQECISLWIVYKAWWYERERIKNILTAIDYWELCERMKMTRIEFALNIMRVSTKLDFWNWKIYNAETIYKHYALVYNEAKKQKEELQKTKKERFIV